MGEEAREIRELHVITIPEDVPEAGIKAGDQGAVVDVLPGGILTVDVVDPATGRTLDMLDLDPGPPLKIIGRWRINEA